MTKGQRAMAVAKLLPEPEKGGRGKKSSVSEEISGTRLSYARTVLRFAPDLADNVPSGAVSLDGAYRTAQERKVDVGMSGLGKMGWKLGRKCNDSPLLGRCGALPLQRKTW